MNELQVENSLVIVEARTAGLVKTAFRPERFGSAKQVAPQKTVKQLVKRGKPGGRQEACHLRYLGTVIQQKNIAGPIWLEIASAQWHKTSPHPLALTEAIKTRNPGGCGADLDSRPLKRDKYP